MKSMTGYGRGEGVQSGSKITAELSAVNRKQSDIVVYLPRELEPLEPQVRDWVNHRIARGRVTVRITLHAAEGHGQLRLNTALARAYAREWQRLAKELHLAGDITLEMLVRAPGVLITEDSVVSAEEFWPPVQKALSQAMTSLIAMREREGAHLAKDLTARMNAMRKSVMRIQRHAPQVVKHYQSQLRLRMQNAGLGKAGVEEQRLLQEVVLFADRADISEELTRLQSHFQQYEDCVKSTAPVGRTLDFLAQEMNREVNTIGSKANDSLISREVIKLKAELEKFREQIQNVE